MLVGGAEPAGPLANVTSRVVAVSLPTRIGGPTDLGPVVGWISSRSAPTSTEPPTFTVRSCRPMSPKPPSANWLSRMVPVLTGMDCTAGENGTAMGATGTLGEPRVVRDMIDRSPPTESPLA